MDHSPILSFIFSLAAAMSRIPFYTERDARGEIQKIVRDIKSADRRAAAAKRKTNIAASPPQNVLNDLDGHCEGEVEYPSTPAQEYDEAVSPLNASMDGNCNKKEDQDYAETSI